jgi:hypothetical protein
MTDIVFADADNPITPHKSIIRDTDDFRVQWLAFNISGQSVPAFTDRLVITSIPEGCPGSDDVEHEIVFDSDIDGKPADYAEPDLEPETAGPLMQPAVGPFPKGSYRLTVTLASDLGIGHETFNCIDIVAGQAPGDDE